MTNTFSIVHFIDQILLQVLVQGWKISPDNLNEFLGAVLRQLEFIEDAVARVSGSCHEQVDRDRKNSVRFDRFFFHFVIIVFDLFCRPNWRILTKDYLAKICSNSSLL